MTLSREDRIRLIGPLAYFQQVTAIALPHNSAPRYKAFWKCDSAAFQAKRRAFRDAERAKSSTLTSDAEELMMPKAEYDVFEALNPFFAVVMEGLGGLVDGGHYFD